MLKNSKPLILHGMLTSCKPIWRATSRPRLLRTMAAASTNSANSGEWKKRSVVSSFLLRGGWRGDQAKPEIALFERSDKVSTYRYV
jgi:hypothetical protein